MDSRIVPVSVIRQWLYSDDENLEARLFAAARDLTSARFGRRITLFAPLYLSNYCVNACRYCAFRRDNRRLVRRTLNDEELQAEARALAALGHRTVLLVAGEDPQRSGPKAVAYAANRVAAVEGVKTVRAEVMPMTLQGYRLLADAGVSSVVLYQETYDRRVYAKAHPAGPKANYAWRLGAPERALEAGIPSVGLGILLGLGNLAGDLMGLVAHARRLRVRWGHWPMIGLPRIQPAMEAPWSVHPPNPVADKTFLRAVAVIRALLPQSGILLSTREPVLLRDQLLQLGIGVTQMSAGSRTDVGGYTHPQSDGQFAIQDERPADAVAALLRGMQYAVAWS